MSTLYQPTRWDGNRPDPWSESQGLHVLALYEDFAAGIRVREALEWLTLEVCPDPPVITKACGFSGLVRPDLRAATRRDAATADIVFVSAAGDRELPIHVESWFESCVAEGIRDSVVLAELHTDEQHSPAFAPPLCSCLQRIARRWRADFICDCDLEARLTRDFISRITRESRAAGTLAGSIY